MKLFREKFKVLSVRQPHADLILSGKKTIELRSWFTNYRGPLLIVVAQRTDRQAMRTMGLDEKDFVRGVALCMVDLVEIKPMDPEDAEPSCNSYDPALYSWFFTNVRPVRQTGFKGQLGLFETKYKPRLI